MRTILKMNEIETIKQHIGSDLYSRLRSSRHICTAPDKFSYFVMFRFTDIKDDKQKDEPVCIYCGETEFYFISNNEYCIKLMDSIDSGKDSYTQLLEFFLLLTADDLDELAKIEDRISGLEDRMLSEKKNNNFVRETIITIRRKLLRIKRYYEQLRIITGEFSEDINDVIPRLLQKRFISLNRRINHLLEALLHLREYITQVREAYQAQIDIEQNQIMKIFTVLTGIFMPLTLLVGWYGMNFPMPEFGWRFGYPSVIILSVMVCAVSIIFFKKKKWF